MKCERCKSEIEPGQRICPVCGRNEDDYDRKEYYGRGRRERSGNGKKVFAVVLSLICSVLLLVGMFYAVNVLDNMGRSSDVNAATVGDAAMDGSTGTVTDAVTDVDTASENTADVSEGSNSSEEEPDNITDKISEINDSSIAAAEAKRSEKYRKIEEKNKDIDKAILIKQLVEQILYFGDDEQIAYMRGLSGKTIVISKELTKIDSTGSWKSVIDGVESYEPGLTALYTDDGASCFSVSIDDMDNVTVYIGTLEDPAKWRISPEMCEEYRYTE